MKTKTIYISGPMTGLPNFNIPAFHAAAAALRRRGFTVINPAEINTDTSKSWHNCMRDDIKALCDSDVIALLPGWEKSSGAHLELHIAHRIGLEVTTLEQLIADVPHNWMCISPGEYDSLYVCQTCQQRHVESIDRPGSEKPVYGCASC